MVLVGLSPILWIVVVWFGKMSSEIGQICPFLFQPDAYSPRRRSACLGEGPLRLGEPVVLFLFLSYVNSRNHQLE